MTPRVSPEPLTKFDQLQALVQLRAVPLRPAVVVVVVTLALRIVVLWLSYGKVPAGDPYNYLMLSKSLAAGQGLAIIDPAYGMTLRAMYPPLYPVLLALCGATQVSALVLNFAIDLAAAAAILGLASLLGQKTAGRFAAAVYLLWPLNILSGAAPQKEGLAALLAILSVVFILERRAAVLGATIGFLALTQPALAPLPLLFALVLRRWESLRVAIPVAIAVLIPWWIRNFLVFGAFVPLTSASGWSLWVGTFGPDGSWIPFPPRLLAGDEIAASRSAGHEAWAWILQHPIDYLGHCLQKLAKSLLGVGWNIDRLLKTADLPVDTLGTPVRSFALAFDVFAICAALLNRGAFALILLACLLHLLAVQMWFEMAERHSYFLTPFLLLTAASGFLQLCRDVHRPNRTE